MATNRTRSDDADGGTGTMGEPHPLEEGRAVTDVPVESNEQNEPRRDRDDKALSYARGPRKSGGGLRFYKPNQGYYTRICTAVAGTAMILWASSSLFEQMTSFMDVKKSYYYPLSYGITVAFLLGMGAALYWVVGLSRRPNEFFIATEGEMKKVSWSSRKEVIRSTKVVIASVVLLGALLFAVDLFFMWFFSAIGVLKAFPGIGAMLSGGAGS